MPGGGQILAGEIAAITKHRQRALETGVELHWQGDHMQNNDADIHQNQRRDARNCHGRMARALREPVCYLRFRVRRQIRAVTITAGRSGPSGSCSPARNWASLPRLSYIAPCRRLATSFVPEAAAPPGPGIGVTVSAAITSPHAEHETRGWN